MTASRLKPHPIPDTALDADIAILGNKEWPSYQYCVKYAPKSP